MQKTVSLFMELQDQRNHFPNPNGDENTCGEWLADTFLFYYKFNSFTPAHNA